MPMLDDTSWLVEILLWVDELLHHFESMEFVTVGLVEVRQGC